MAHTALLRLENKEYKILECEYEFTQPVSVIGHPTGYPRGGLIHLTIVSPDNSDLFLHNWMQIAAEHKDGRIDFTVVNMEKSSTKTLRFKRGYCVRLYEFFNANADMQMQSQITVSAVEISFGEAKSVDFKNDKRN